MDFKNGSEDWEQQQLVNWLRIKDYKFTSIPNSTFTKSWKQKAKNRALGLNPGMSDLIIVLKRGNILFLELKKARGKQGGLNGSVISKHQLEWQEIINTCEGSQYEIGHGYKDCIDIITKLEDYEQ